MSEYKTEEEAVQAAEANATEEGLVDFDGQNCDDYRDEGYFCLGWDGFSRRCDCGNRRVYWATYKNDDGTWYARAEAY